MIKPKFNIVLSQDWLPLLMLLFFVYCGVGVTVRLLIVGLESWLELLIFPFSLFGVSVCGYILWQLARPRRCPACGVSMERVRPARNQGECIKHRVRCPKCGRTLLTGITSGPLHATGLGRKLVDEVGQQEPERNRNEPDC